MAMLLLKTMLKSLYHQNFRTPNIVIEGICFQNEKKMLRYASHTLLGDVAYMKTYEH